MALIAAAGLSMIRCLSTEIVFPKPTNGYSTNTISYAHSPLNAPCSIPLADVSHDSPAELNIPAWAELGEYDGIRITGNISWSNPETATIVVFAEYSRQYKQTTQIVASTTDLYQPQDGRIDVELDVAHPEHSGEYNVFVSCLPLKADGEPINPEPILLYYGQLNIPD